MAAHGLGGRGQARAALEPDGQRGGPRGDVAALEEPEEDAGVVGEVGEGRGQGESDVAGVGLDAGGGLADVDLGVLGLWTCWNRGWGACLFVRDLDA